MAKRRKKRKQRSGQRSPTNSIDKDVRPDVADDSAARPGVADEPATFRFIEQSRSLYLALFVVLLLGYLWLFYSAPFTVDASGSPMSRFEFQRLLMVDMPDFLRLWTNEDVSKCNVLDRAPILLAALLIVFLGTIIGRRVLSSTRADEGLTRLETAIFSAGVGLSLLSLLTLGIGLTIGFHQRVMCLVIYFGAGGAALVYWLRYRMSRPVVDPVDLPRPRDPRDWLSRRAIWIIVPFVVVILLGAMLPPRSFDVREYHLQVPKEWYQQGRIGFVEHNVYGNMPMGAEMHAIIGMIIMDDWWLGALVGKTVIASFTVLTALALFAFGRRFINTTAGVVAAVVYISIPWVSLVSMHGLIEGVFGFYFATAVYAWLLWARGDDKSRRTSTIALTGFLAGSAVACKYPALLFVVVPIFVGVCVLPKNWLMRRAAETGATHRWRSAAVFLLAVACACGPWLGKNWVLTGNPTYPLLYGVFGGRALTPETARQWRTAHAVPRDEDGRSFSAGQFAASAADVLWKSVLLSPLLMPLAALALIVKKHLRLVWLLAALYLFVLAAWWLLTHRHDRFWVPVLPIVALLAGIGATWTSARLWQHAVIAILFWGCVCNLQMMASKAMQDVRFVVSLDELRTDPPRADAPIQSRIHPAHRALNLNAHVPDGYRVLMVGNAEPFDLEVAALYNTCFNECIFTKLLKGKTAREQLAALRDAKIAFVFVDWKELDRHRSPGGYGYSSDYPQIATLKSLVEQGVLSKPTPPFADDADPRPLSQIFAVRNSIK